MSSFLQASLNTDDYWRAIILYGRNVASYKFALAKSLLELAGRDRDMVSLEELGEPFSRHLGEHLRLADKQSTSRTSTFLDTLRSYNRGETGRDELLLVTERLGFVNVIDAFHQVGRDDIEVRFFIDERSQGGGIRLTDELRTLHASGQLSNLTCEVEARWRLVETAWELNLPSSAVTIEYDPGTEQLLPDGRRFRRPAITGSRDALNGYQKGRCFYCASSISVLPGSPDLADVDHFFPHLLKPQRIAHPIDGVWNLVLACRTCNRGPSGKWHLLPTLPYLERLERRNTYLIESHHPLRETLIAQTGASVQARRSFLQRAYTEAHKHLIHTWRPNHEHEPTL